MDTRIGPHLVIAGGLDLLTGPALRTRAGCRARVALLSLGERARVAWALGVADPEGEKIARALHGRNHKKRTRRSDGSDRSVGS